MKLRHLVGAALVACAALASNGEARADGPAQAFGHVGHLAVSSDADISLTHTNISGGGDSTTLSLRPSADYFVVQNFSVGGFVPFQYTTSGNFSTTLIGVGVRAGYDLAFADQVSFWPRAGFSFASVSTSFSGNAGPTATSTSNSNSALTLNIYAPLLVHPAEHFFFGLGPRLDVGLTGDAKTTIYGLTFIIGGYFLGD